VGRKTQRHIFRRKKLVSALKCLNWSRLRCYSMSMNRNSDSRALNALTATRPVTAYNAGRIVMTAQALLASAILAFALAVPGVAAPAVPVKAAEKQKFSLEASAPLSPFQANVSDPRSFSFTVPGTGAASARAQTVERAFRFTPSGQIENRKALSIGVATRVAAASPERNRTLAAAEPMVVTPRAYDVDVSVGWKGFAFNTGFSHSETTGRSGVIGTERDALDVGLSYGGKNWSTSVQGTAEDRSAIVFSPIERRYSVALGGAYMVAPRLSIRGGVRYRLPTETPSLIDVDRADQSVYVGTNIAF